MSFYFSAATGGFYHSAVHAEMPADAVAVTAERHAELMAAQAAGLRIVAGEAGAPIAEARPVYVPPPIRVITPLAFRRRFGAKRAAITAAAAADLAAGNAALQVFLDDLAAAQVVELDNPEIAAGLDLVQARGLISAEDRAAILADGVPAEAP